MLGHVFLFQLIQLCTVKDKKELIGPIPKFVKYRAAIGCSIYNKATFNKLILEGKNIWEHDVNNDPNNWDDKFYALSTNLKIPLFPHQHGVIKW